ncbi:Na+/H+ antiporter subunit D [Bacillus horti]|uniref:Multicomponent Na+:H+ antiporter subunit D n=1 Tax=Caldalkalibacillus horti TaxID=77523 RepID=A0ABT9VT32_9BACI|nr:Na+/H+ antiporter subunit D [Bacillus horti]MDQ0164141.1 multicomponent Na+:H+ antiporter subunit D [Bacillus horti]
MNNIVVLPILIPLLTGIILLFFRNQIKLQRALSTLSLLLVAGVSFYLIYEVNTYGIQTLRFGGWVPPYGIVFVADMLAVLLVAATAIVALACLWFAFRSIGEAREKFYFYPIFQFQIVGVCGSFLTGDLFNLFVCFEVMLLASYVLISIGGTKRQLRESIKYLLINIISSALFVASIAYLYAITGTLNIAHLSERIAEAGQGPLLTLVSILLMIVFSLKAALFLYFWLPGAYSAPPTPIAALFSALLTKVGIYALIRVFTIIFYHEAGITHMLLGWLAVVTIIMGVIGAVGSSDVRKILAYNVVAAVGFIILGLAFFSTTSLAGAIFYLIHDMVIKALLFLLGGLTIAIAGTSQLKKMGGLMKQYPLIGWMVLVSALALAGVPPLSGFIGKLLIVQGGLEASEATGIFFWFVIVSLVTSLLILYSIVKIFLNAYWSESKMATSSEETFSLKGLVAPCAFLLLLSMAIGLGAEAILPFVWQAAETLMDPSIYIDAIQLKE